MKRIRSKIVCPLILLLLFLGLGGFVWYYNKPLSQKPVAKDVFLEDAALETDTSVIGTNIYLHQKIHNTDGTITYRYKLETDCTFWIYEDRYETKVPLAWVDDQSAVETKATSVSVRYDGTVYATGQYFEVPLLNLCSSDRTFEDYESDLLQTAYVTYRSGFSSQQSEHWIWIGLGLLGVCFAGFLFLDVCLAIINTRRKSEEKEPSCVEEKSAGLLFLDRPSDRQETDVYLVPAGQMPDQNQLERSDIDWSDFIKPFTHIGTVSLWDSDGHRLPLAGHVTVRKPDGTLTERTEKDGWVCLTCSDQQATRYDLVLAAIERHGQEDAYGKHTVREIFTVTADASRYIGTIPTQDPLGDPVSIIWIQTGTEPVS